MARCVIGVHIELSVIILYVFVEVQYLAGGIVEKYFFHFRSIAVQTGLNQEWNSHEHIIDPNCIFFPV